MANSFLKAKLEAQHTYILELEIENHTLKESKGTIIKQDPDSVAQFESTIAAQTNRLDAAKDQISKLERELVEWQQYTSNLKITVSSQESSLKAIQQSSSGTKGKLTSTLAEAQVEIASLKKELRDVKTAKHRADVEINILKKQNPSAMLDIDWKIKKPSAATTTLPKTTITPATITDKRKREHVNSNATNYASKSSKTKSKCNDSYRDDSEPDDLLENMPLSQRKALAIKRENHEDEMPLSQRRKIALPTSQVAKVKLHSSAPLNKKGTDLSRSAPARAISHSPRSASNIMLREEWRGKPYHKGLGFSQVGQGGDGMG